MAELGKTTALRLPKSVLDRAAALVEPLSGDGDLRERMLPGQTVTRSTVMRLALDAGLQQMERFYSREDAK